MLILKANQGNLPIKIENTAGYWMAERLTVK